jgi:hypothetical protein
MFLLLLLLRLLLLLHLRLRLMPAGARTCGSVECMGHESSRGRVPGG